MNNEAVAVRTENLLKSFGDYRAIDNLDLNIKRGEIYGLVGPDGAGKTTLMRILTAIMESDSGQAWVAGHSVIMESEAVKEKIGYMSQRFGLYEDLTVMENIIFYADLYDVPRKERPERVERLLGFSNLAPFKARLAGKLSGGMKQKLGLACALIHTPEILFLDEPTNGVDPVSRRDFWKILYDLLKEGITIFVSTAYLDEAERCTRVGLIHKGKLLAEGDPAAMKKSFGYPMIALWADDVRGAMKALKMVPGVKNINIYGDRLHIALEGPDLMETIVYELQAAGIVMKSYRNIVPTLEDIFITMVAGDE
ncbi:MAG TPA: ABC transporter ATP-binding protein [Nitrospirae bacterium]|nr:ABC transporter ATP-binding protein [Nitrospirota bacterium]HDY71245.1 ABC transporter ATP-binding protein [Nitrospirota bacterium]